MALLEETVTSLKLISLHNRLKVRTVHLEAQAFVNVTSGLVFAVNVEDHGLKPVVDEPTENRARSQRSESSAASIGAREDIAKCSHALPWINQMGARD